MIKKVLILFFIIFVNNSIVIANEDFNIWLNSFKNIAVDKGISNETIEKTLGKAVFLPEVIKYDRYQP